MRGCLAATVAGLVLASLLAAPAAGESAHPAAGRVAFVLWTGGVAGGTSEGVALHADGTGERLQASPGGGVADVGAFNPKGTKLAAIRAAASEAVTGPRFVDRMTPGPASVDR